MWLFDAHLDLALNAVDWNRDLRQSVDDIRAQEQAQEMRSPGRGTNTLSLPELKSAGVAVCLTTLLARQEKEISHDFGYTTPESCYAMAHAHLAYYRAMETCGWLKQITTSEQLQSHVSDFISQPQTTPLGYILTMEGADPLLTPDTVYEFHSHGLRAIGLTHYGANRYGGGTRTEVGLALDAVPLIENIEKLEMTIDVTHLSDKAFWQLLDIFSGKVHASHQNSRRICDWQRQFDDRQYLAVIDRGGMIGLAMDIIMIQPGFVRGSSSRIATLDRLVDNVDIICQLAGNTNHVGIGSDLDGAYGCEQTPADLDRYADLPIKFAELLQKRGYSDTDIQGIMHENWYRFFCEALP